MIAKFIMMSFKPSPNKESAALLKMQAFVKEIYSLMACNKLKLNRDKMFSVTHAKHRPRSSISDIKIAGVSGS